MLCFIKSWLYGSLAGICEFEYLSVGAWNHVSCDFYVALRRADHSSRGALPIIVCLSVIV